MMSIRNRIAADERGASVIELALTAPILAALLIGMVDISRGYSVKLQVEQAAQRTIEKVTLQELTSTNYSAILKTEGAAAAGVAESAVVPDYWLECNGTRQASSVTSCPDGQSYAWYISVEIAKTYTPLFRTRFAGSNTNGTFTLHGEAGVRIQ
jgi:Flp pilus assembly protein TadG